ncbi:hypothetical protein Taro_047939 [Colocasia esculenta]|uniref:Uncharacterized protein n=1 Tax=Colocasia esculenta TaxID=4460 RepID=A0A843WWT0_COLES|nr:hypothetical protein [Colocasia esculenta]
MPDGAFGGDDGDLGASSPTADTVFSPVVRLCGPADWARSAHRFSACERDKGVRRILNATALVVAFLLLSRCGPRLHASHVSHTGRHADVSLEKVTPYSVTFRRDSGAEALWWYLVVAGGVVELCSVEVV